MGKDRLGKSFEVVRKYDGKFPSGKEIFRGNGIYVYQGNIGKTYTSYSIVYFVSGVDGDEYGQFANKNDALKKAKKMSKIKLSERRKFDE